MRTLICFSLLLCTALLFGFLGPTNLAQTTIQTVAAQRPAFQHLSFLQNSAQPSPSVPATARKELLAAARAHRVSIKTDKIVYVNNKYMTIVRAPITGINKYSDDDFAKGAPFVLMILKSKIKLAVPDGSYLVKLQYQRTAKSGNAIFTDTGGSVVAVRGLDAPVLTLPDFPDRNDHGEGLEPCSGYGEMFDYFLAIYPHQPPLRITICSECACRHNQWGQLYDAGEAGTGRVIDAWFRGRQAGRECLASRPSTRCPDLPPGP